jgi:hypothetical protein
MLVKYIRIESTSNRLRPINLPAKRAGERSAGNLHAPFDVAGDGNQLTVRLVRHSQRKRRAPDRSNLRGMAPFLDPTSRLRLSEGAKTTLPEIAHRLGRKALEDVAAAVKPDTILSWYRKLIANKFDGSKFRQSVELVPQIVPAAFISLATRYNRYSPEASFETIGQKMNAGLMNGIRRKLCQCLGNSSGLIFRISKATVAPIVRGYFGLPRPS